MNFYDNFKLQIAIVSMPMGLLVQASVTSTANRLQANGGSHPELQNSRCQANTVAGVGRLHHTTKTSSQLMILFATNVISKVTTPDTAKPNARLMR